MVNLAPLKYAKVLRTHGGPIERVACHPLRHREEWYQAVAFLSPHLNLKKSGVEVFGDADGTGTDRSPMLARFKAISEALERWALYFLLQCGETDRYGLDIDPSSNGMAAYPGLFRAGARWRARVEAVERYCLIQWWKGELRAKGIPCSEDGLYAAEIENPLTSHKVVIVWRKNRHGLYAYGFAAARNLRQALEGARIEMDRASAAMGIFLTRNPTFGPADMHKIKNWQERRVLWFAMDEGHEQFYYRLRESLKVRSQPDSPLPVVDSELLGPWSRYAHVWRVLYPVSDDAHLDPAENFFFW
jgi:ribosomal protein S12 methylthiotransferase accessory factor YcaO